jgi:hypothetical protein
MKTTLTKKNYKKVLIFFLFITTIITAQVGINTTNPSTDSMLDIISTDKGLLVPRVDIININTIAPITGGSTESLLVYNTNLTTGKGYFYWNGSIWVNLNSNDWKIEGNNGTNSTNNFLGTTDNIHLAFRTDNNERMRILNDGRVSVNEINPFAANRFTVTGNIDEYAINSFASGSGVGVYALNTGSGTTTVSLNTGTGHGTYSSSENNHGVYASTASNGGAFLTGGILSWGTGLDGANGVLAVTDKQATSNSNIGIRVISGSTTSISSSQILNVGVNINATDLAFYALTEGTVGVRESARFQTNYSGFSTDADNRDMRAQLAGYTNTSQQGGSSMYYGGYFYSGGDNNGSWAYSGARYDNTNYKIIGNGIVSTVVEGANKIDTKKIMFAPEAPEVLFEDYGIGKLVNGIVKIDIDPIFSNNITVNNEHPLKVFIQLEGDCKGVYVINKSKHGFTVKELQNGYSNTSFSWHIVANRKDEVASRTNEITMYENLRFPDAPSNILPKENKVSKLEKNSYKDTKNEK